MKRLKKRGEDQAYRMNALERVFLDGEDFNLCITQDSESHILTIEIKSNHDRIMTPVPVMSLAAVKSDAGHQIIRLVAKEITSGTEQKHRNR